jgi:hypothetical protein
MSRNEGMNERYSKSCRMARSIVSGVHTYGSSTMGQAVYFHFMVV